MIITIGILLISPLWITTIECLIAENGLNALDNMEKDTKDKYSSHIENNPSKCNTTSLHFAIGLLRSLIVEGHDPYAVDCDGLSPVDIAVNGKIQSFLNNVLPLKTESTTNVKPPAEHCSSTPLHNVVHIIQKLINESNEEELKDCQGLLPSDFINVGALNGMVVEMVLIFPRNVSQPEIEPTSGLCNSTKLHQAVIDNNVVNLLQILENKPDVYAIDCDGYTPMDLAVVRNHSEVMLHLAQAQYDVNRIRHDGQSLLSLALREGSIETITTLLNLGANLNEINADISTIFDDALTNNRMEVVQLLMSYGANMNYMSKDGNSFLHSLAESGNTHGIVQARKFGLIRPEIVNLQNYKKETALSKAVKGNYPAIVNILISSGANMSSLVEGGETYLHLAVRNKSIDALQALLENGVPVGLKNKDNETALHLAVELDIVEPMDTLKSFGADIQEKYEDETLLHKAALFDSPRAIAWLLKNGHEVDEEANNKFTPLHIAAKYGNKAAVDELITKNASLTCKTAYEDTPLHWAAWEGNVPIVQEILSKGVFVDLKQKSGWTPLHVAVQRSHLEVVKELISKGANVNALNNANHTPLYMATNNEITEFMKSKGGVLK